MDTSTNIKCLSNMFETVETWGHLGTLEGRSRTGFRARKGIARGGLISGTVGRSRP